MGNFTREELKNVLALVKVGARSMDLDGNGTVAVGVLIKKIEDLMKAPVETPAETKEVSPVTSTETKKVPPRGTALVN